MVSHPILGEIVRPDLLTTVCASDQVSAQVAAVYDVLCKFPVHETCTEHLERSATVLKLVYERAVFLIAPPLHTWC